MASVSRSKARPARPEWARSASTTLTRWSDQNAPMLSATSSAMARKTRQSLDASEDHAHSPTRAITPRESVPSSRSTTTDANASPPSRM